MESVEVREEEEKTRCSKDKDKESLPHMDQGSRKRKSEETQDDDNHQLKRRREFDTGKDLHDLICSQIPRTKWRIKDEGSSDLFAEV